MPSSLWRREPSSRLGGVTIPFVARAPGEGLAAVAAGFFEAPSGGAVVTGAAALSATSGLTATAVLVVPGAAPLSASGGLSGTALLELLGAVALSGAGALSATSMLTAMGAAALSGAGNLVGVIVGDAVALPTVPAVAWRRGASAAWDRRSVTRKTYPGQELARKARGGR